MEAFYELKNNDTLAKRVRAVALKCDAHKQKELLKEFYFIETFPLFNSYF